MDGRFCFGGLQFRASHHRSEAGNSRERSAGSCADKCAHRRSAGQDDRERNGADPQRDHRRSRAGRESAGGSARLGPGGENDLCRVHRRLQPVGFAGDTEAGTAAHRHRPGRSECKAERSATRKSEGNALVESTGDPGAAGGGLSRSRQESDQSTARPGIQQCAGRAGTRRFPRIERAHRSSGSGCRHDGGVAGRGPTHRVRLRSRRPGRRPRLSEFAHGKHRADPAKFSGRVVVSGGAGRLPEKSRDDRAA